MKNLISKLISFFTPTPKGEFPATPKGFTAAKNWAQNQPHPYSENLTLWESIYTTNDDGWYVLQRINRHKKLYDAYKKCKDNKECNEVTLRELENEIF